MTKKIIEQSLEGPTGTLYTKRYTPNTDQIGDLLFPQFVDFPYIEDPVPFTTHRALENWLYEQGAGEAKEEPEEAPADNPLGDAKAEDNTAPGTDPSTASGMDPMMGGEMTGQTIPMSSSEIGRIYELKKIYSRLTAIEVFLSRSVDSKMLALRKYVAQAIDLFEVVISNIAQYKEKIDDIIVTFYKFLDYVYGSIRKYFSEEY